MKRIINILSLLLIVVFAGCELEPQVQILENPVGADIIYPTAGEAFNYTWDNNTDSLEIILSSADYGFDAQITYTVEFDVKGGDFSRSRTLVFGYTDTLKTSVKDFNTQVKKLKFKDGDVAELDMRVTSLVSEFYPLIISPIIPVTFVPYSEPKVEEPEDPTDPEEPVDVVSDLFMIGASTGGWDLELAVPLKAGNDGVFTITAYFDASNGANFRFFTDADWGASYGGYDVFETYPSDIIEPAAGDNDPNFNFIGSAGWYLVVANTSEGTIEMTATTAPELYLTGDATHGWSWDEPVSTVVGTANNIFEGDIAFIQNNAFRVFAQKDWSPTSYGWDYLTEYDETVLGIMEGHADPNWQFLAESGTYHVKIDMKNLSIEITQ